mmetsp:Transcript_14449/g.50263  ORF Transcript_14449/g.50263 Transcript_14449/m.50263 type:complete len:340 (-) Transcript_14449:123-1142(-)
MLSVLLTFEEDLNIFLGVYFGIPIGLVLLYCLFRFRVVEQGTSMVVERYGKFHRRCDAGWHWLVPFADQPRRVTWRLSETYLQGNWQAVKIQQYKTDRIDLRENIMDFPNQPVITRDNVEIQVHPMLVYKLIDPVRVAYETYDLSHAVEKLVQTALRSIIGDMGLDDTLASREEIERGLRLKVQRVCHNWGLEIMSVELLEITPTETVQDAMHKQLAAERVRRASIVEADGNREQMKTVSEGECQSQIALANGHKAATVLRAKGTADSRVLIARAEAEAVRVIAEQLHAYGVNATAYLIGLKYIETFTTIACHANSRKLYLPFETDVVGATALIAERDD